ncbi:methyltransferase [Leptospira idonii]|uniref:Methyltransferase n=1 Tax=Leptospira idonii TaxID=1193500 RepID=A0A4R9M279_9LEPT|nr:methyltransferase [Leptospira idonii]TGN19817.1 methyltransferase [Leptospira idonii]
MKDDVSLWKEKITNVKNITDDDFDLILPEPLRLLSPYQWTSVSVIKSISEYLKTEKVTSFVDLGSGPGKLAILLSLWNSFPVTGVEIRKELFQFADFWKKKLDIGHLKFLQRDFLNFDISLYSHVYCFNPLYEQMTGRHSIDESLPKSSMLYVQNLIRLKEKFKELKPGTKIITYYGFGGRMPSDFKRIRKIGSSSDELEVWEKLRI